jgi:hypothetical protein
LLRQVQSDYHTVIDIQVGLPYLAWSLISESFNAAAAAPTFMFLWNQINAAAPDQYAIYIDADLRCQSQ